jgi:hypothetical protein
MKDFHPLRYSVLEYLRTTLIPLSYSLLLSISKEGSMLLGKYWIVFEPTSRCSVSGLHNPFLDARRMLNCWLSDFVFGGSELDSEPRDHLC